MSMMTPGVDDGAADSDRNVGLRFGAHRYFYPRGIMLPDGRILASMRCQRDPTSVLWTDIFQSDDGGRTWAFLSRVNDWGAPGDLVRMQDGRSGRIQQAQRLSNRESQTLSPAIAINHEL